METRKRKSPVIPFGWSIHPEDSKLLIEHEEEQDALTYVREISETTSIRKLADVLHSLTGRKVSPRGMQLLLERDF